MEGYDAALERLTGLDAGLQDGLHGCIPHHLSTSTALSFS